MIFFFTTSSSTYFNTTRLNLISVVRQKGKDLLHISKQIKAATEMQMHAHGMQQKKICIPCDFSKIKQAGIVLSKQKNTYR